MAARIEPDGGWNTNRLKPDHPPVKAARKPARERGRQRDEAHIALIRRLPCIASGSMVSVEAAHIRFSEDDFGKAGPGHSAKPSDEWTLPLCHDEHMRQHSMAEREYWAQLGIEPLKIAQRLYGISAGLRGSTSEEDIVRALTNIVIKARAEARPGG